MKALTEVTPNVRFYPNLTCSTSLSHWVFDSRVVLIGDAAHAHGGAYTTGGSLAIEDAYTLYLSLLSVFPVTATQKPSLESIEKAFNLYEATRKPHADRLLDRVRSEARATALRVREKNWEKDEDLRARAAKGTHNGWLHEHDAVAAFEKTLKQVNGSGAVAEKSLL